MSNVPLGSNDPAGTRPPGAPRRTAAQLLRIALAETCFRFGKLFVVTLFMGLVSAAVTIPICYPAYLLLKGQQKWIQQLYTPLYWPLLLPLAAGYAYTVLLIVQNLAPRNTEIIRPFRSRARYFNVLIAGIPATLGPWLLDLATEITATVMPETLWPDHPLLTGFLRTLPGAAYQLMFLPFGFAALDAVVTECPFTSAWIRSLRFAAKNSRLFAGFALVTLADSLFRGILSSMSGLRASGTVGSLPSFPFAAPLLCGGLILALVAFVFALIFLAVVMVVFYREFVWREREATAAAAG